MTFAACCTLDSATPRATMLAPEGRLGGGGIQTSR
eukprot:CAMPEP_0119536712 /NCGR_PEP_ID=MMETSP1344-20130328/49503_1 /TAXON_ID=236787 /ORGANISM="Florenciella parvula, Strain CCMP2471" /LENGTH=34 /DNA_ID= /DNA_START= /DNA_END= /DNA_ORIENTATION=